LRYYLFDFVIVFSFSSAIQLCYYYLNLFNPNNKTIDTALFYRWLLNQTILTPNELRIEN